MDMFKSIFIYLKINHLLKVWWGWKKRNHYSRKCRQRRSCCRDFTFTSYWKKRVCEQIH